MAVPRTPLILLVILLCFSVPLFVAGASDTITTTNEGDVVVTNLIPSMTKGTFQHRLHQLAGNTAYQRFLQVPDDNATWYFLVREVSGWVLHVKKVTSGSFSPSSSNEEVYCKARVNNTRMSTGWNEIIIEAAPNVHNPDEIESYYEYCGYLEGYITQREIKTYRSVLQNLSIPVSQAEVPQEVAKFVNEQFAYLRARILEERYTSVYWRSVSGLLNMLQGVANGYNDAREKHDEKLLGLHDVYYMNLRHEIADIFRATKQSEPLTQWHKKMRAFAFSSTLIKNVGEDILIGHSAAEQYSAGLMPIHKTWKLDSDIVATTFPGCLTTGDNWLLTSHRLALLTTRNQYFDDSVAVKHLRPTTVPTFMRVMVASTTATSGSTWIDTFAFNASGTHASQYTIFDQNRFESPVSTKAPHNGATMTSRTEKKDTSGVQQHSGIGENLLLIVEEMPGLLLRSDETQTFSVSGVWAAYNVPFFSQIQSASGYQALELKSNGGGKAFSYQENARAKILTRNASTIQSVEDLMSVLRYNNYEQDDLSQIQGTCANVTCDPEYSPLLAVAGRADLVSKTATLPVGPFQEPLYERGFYGAVDAKVTSANKLGQVGLVDMAICGPVVSSRPYGGGDNMNEASHLPPFEWRSKSTHDDVMRPWNPNPEMIASSFDFDWVDFPTGLRPNSNGQSGTEPEHHGGGPSVGLILGLTVAAIAGLILLTQFIRCFMPRHEPEQDDCGVDVPGAGGVPWYVTGHNYQQPPEASASFTEAPTTWAGGGGGRRVSQALSKNSSMSGSMYNMHVGTTARQSTRRSHQLLPPTATAPRRDKNEVSTASSSTARESSPLLLGTPTVLPTRRTATPGEAPRPGTATGGGGGGGGSDTATVRVVVANDAGDRRSVIPVGQGFSLT